MFKLFTITNKYRVNCSVLKLALTLILCVPSYVNANNKGLDPTKPLFGGESAQIMNVGEKLILEGIFHGSHGGNTHTVIINGQSLKVNDTIGEYRLVAVNDDSVVLRSSDKRLKLAIFSGVVKRQK